MHLGDVQSPRRMLHRGVEQPSALAVKGAPSGGDEAFPRAARGRTQFFTGADDDVVASARGRRVGGRVVRDTVVGDVDSHALTKVRRPKLA